ncbi:MAG: IS3 family transposase [Eubacterium sp.]|nr:IS3 family transposase [Eubacterium sp.]
MYSYEDRMRAVKLYIQYDYSFASVKRELGYPKHHFSLQQWLAEYQEHSDLKHKSTREPKYSTDQRTKAINHYYNHGRCVSRTVRALGYPSRTLLKQWLCEEHPEDFPCCSKGSSLVRLSEEQKEQAVLDLCSREGSAQDVADKYNVSRYSLYNWKHQFLPEGSPTKMPKVNVHTDPESHVDQIEKLHNEVDSLSAEAAELKKQIHRLQLEKDALQKAAEIIKKDQGISLDTLTNREKAIVIDALRSTYQLKELLDIFHMAKSSYCYQKQSMNAPDKYKDAREQIRLAFTESYESYGYRRLYVCVKKEDGSNYSEKVIRRLMAEEDLVVKRSKRKKYSSYQGEITPAVENLIKRDFHADKPNEKWLTDITEFRIPAGKVYLSPIIDCYDGLPTAWTIGTSPSAELVNTMLEEAVLTLKDGEHPTVHSDRGCHYRWPGWIERMEKAGLTRSMSKKGCSPDNSACEGFFGRIKNEMFYNRSWADVTINEFIEILDRYIHWYAEKRIKISLGGLSPIQYRKAQGLAA